MKKSIIALSLMMVCAAASATSTLWNGQITAGSTGIEGGTEARFIYFADDGAPCLWLASGSASNLSCPTLGTGLSLSVDGKTLNVSGITGATGPKGDTGATGSQGVKGDTGLIGATGAAGVSPIVNRARITTASDGTYTWTYPTACPAGSVPIIQMTPEGSASTTYNTVITAAPTNTAVSIKITQVVDTVILSTIHVLGVQPASASLVHLTAVCP